MGVMQCERRGCCTVLCDHLITLETGDYSDREFYICTDCLTALKHQAATYRFHSKRQRDEYIRGFMRGALNDAYEAAEQDPRYAVNSVIEKGG